MSHSAAASIHITNGRETNYCCLAGIMNSNTDQCRKTYRWRVGYWISEKKLKKMNFDEFTVIARSVNIELVKMDLEAELEAQGPYDAILHKLSDLLVLSDQGDSHSCVLVGKLETFLANHPEIVVLDPFHCVRQLCDRYQQYTLIQEVCKTDNVYTPSFVDLLNMDIDENACKLRTAGVRYPFVCKPLVAHGSDYAHQMSIIFNEQSLKDVQPPCVAQTFIHHNAVLYKVFVVGDRYFVVPRPSLKNFKAGPHPTIFFDSHEVSKEGCSSSLSELDDEDKDRLAPPLLDERVGAVVRDIRRKTDISLFGLDIIVETDTGFHYIIDVNNFPSYDGVKQFYTYLVELIVEALTKQESKLAAQKTFPYASKIFMDDYADSTVILPPRKTTTAGFDIAAPLTMLPPCSPIVVGGGGVKPSAPPSTLTDPAKRSAVDWRTSYSKSMSECLLDSGIGSSSCTESDNSDSERKLLKALRLNQQRCRTASSNSQKSSSVSSSEPSHPSVSARLARSPRHPCAAPAPSTTTAVCDEKFATISTPTAACAERARQLLQQQHSVDNWTRIKRFYGIPKPTAPKK